MAKKRQQKPAQKKATAKKRKGKNLGQSRGVKAYNLVRRSLIAFYENRGIILTDAEKREYAGKLYGYLKENSRAYKNGNVRILKKTVEDTLRGDVRTHHIFAKEGIPYPGSSDAEDVFYYWHLSEQLAEYDQKHDRITVDLRIMSGFRGLSVLRYANAGDAQLDAHHPIVSSINAWVNFIDDQGDDDSYLVFERSSVGENDWKFTLMWQQGTLGEISGTEAGTITDEEPGQPPTQAAISPEEQAERTREAKARADEAEQSAGEARAKKTAAIIAGKNAEIKALKEQRVDIQKLINEILKTIALKRKSKMKTDREKTTLAKLESELEELEFLESVTRSEIADLKKSMDTL